MKKFIFHVLGLSHAQTKREYSCDAFSQKVRLICKMLTERGHHVIHYGTEGSDPICSENVDVLSYKTFAKDHKKYDWKKDGFLISNELESTKEFNRNAILRINERKGPTDFLLCSFGVQHEPVANEVKPIIVTELGIGYELSFAPHRIFESYSYMHYIYGKEGLKLKPNFYDAVIPNYYDLNDYIYSEKKDDYFFFIARDTPLKGLEIAIKATEAVGGKLIVAGQGTPPFESPCMKFIGVVSIEERAKWMSKAKATFVPSYYIEPFGGTVIESLLAGTPVISTDFGAFPETVIHGKVGYRCRSLEQFIWAAKNIGNIKPIDCRNWAVNNYSLERVAKMYEEYFDMVQRIYIDKQEGWYQHNDERTELDWLKKIF